MEENLRASLSASVADALTDPAIDSVSGASLMVFLVIAGLGLAMALVYVPLRLFLTITARSRRLRLLQRIRRLREELGQPIQS
ncbi:hypothetical protein VB734_12110 [Synechococcus sp. BA-124 BA4]|jgi:hypothetical protein|uniref:hypothetical protein n=1 Tax=unclassified Synechococcus TaxID=2626047 RepID=UPI0018CD165E|nr:MULTISPECIES: hypothetical protein [unclassified Synechococcus]MEA5400783.1 hypothetical protein [Synechococcus sp. BA-124 BA4]QPN58434.1 hypothetical protein I1E95_03295 [Synechococcus sp. CBW1107]CAK6693825.1 hypothetical protein BBFGKLBO_01520 [Synechococcus sp. CBW1107]